jgi:hypothetical protein
MPYTTVVAGTTITASWGNANVRDQVVTPFASAAARTSAITSPVAGMVSTRTDGKIAEVYFGAAWGAITGLTNPAIFNSLGGCTLSTSSASYVDVVNATINWTKRGGSADSDVLVALMAEMYVGVNATTAVFGIGIGGADTDVVQCYCSTSGTVAGTRVGLARITGLAAAAYTPKVRAKRTAGTGVLTVDSLCNMAFFIAELPVGG